MKNGSSYVQSHCGCCGQNLSCSSSTIPALPEIKDLRVSTGAAVGVTKVRDLLRQTLSFSECLLPWEQVLPPSSVRA